MLNTAELAARHAAAARHARDEAARLAAADAALRRRLAPADVRGLILARARRAWAYPPLRTDHAVARLWTAAAGLPSHDESLLSDLLLRGASPFVVRLSFVLVGAAGGAAGAAVAAGDGAGSEVLISESRAPAAGGFLMYTTPSAASGARILVIVMVLATAPCAPQALVTATRSRPRGGERRLLDGVATRERAVGARLDCGLVVRVAFAA